jgi:hypothetical protein
MPLRRQPFRSPVLAAGVKKQQQQQQQKKKASKKNETGKVVNIKKTTDASARTYAPSGTARKHTPLWLPDKRRDDARRVVTDKVWVPAGRLTPACVAAAESVLAEEPGQEKVPDGDWEGRAQEALERLSKRAESLRERVRNLEGAQSTRRTRGDGDDAVRASLARWRGAGRLAVAELVAESSRRSDQQVSEEALLASIGVRKELLLLDDG